MREMRDELCLGHCVGLLACINNIQYAIPDEMHFMFTIGLLYFILNYSFIFISNHYKHDYAYVYVLHENKDKRIALLKSCVVIFEIRMV